MAEALEGIVPDESRDDSSRSIAPKYWFVPFGVTPSDPDYIVW